MGPPLTRSVAVSMVFAWCLRILLEPGQNRYATLSLFTNAYGLFLGNVVGDKLREKNYPSDGPYKISHL
jgi:hypothetical protein